MLRYSTRKVVPPNRRARETAQALAEAAPTLAAITKRTRGKQRGVPILVRLQPDQLERVDQHRTVGMSRADVLRLAITKL